MMTDREKLEEFLEAQPDFNDVLRQDILDTFDHMGGNLHMTLNVWKIEGPFRSYFEWV